MTKHNIFSFFYESMLIQIAGNKLFKKNQALKSEKILVKLLKMEAKFLGFNNELKNIELNIHTIFELLSKILQFKDKIKNYDLFLLTEIVFCFSSLHFCLENLPYAYVLSEFCEELTFLAKNLLKVSKINGLKADILTKILRYFYLLPNSKTIYYDCKKLYENIFKKNFVIQQLSSDLDYTELCVVYEKIKLLYNKEKQILQFYGFFNREKIINADNEHFLDRTFLEIQKHQKSLKKRREIGKQQFTKLIRDKFNEFQMQISFFSAEKQIEYISDIFELSYNYYELYKNTQFLKGTYELFDKFLDYFNDLENKIPFLSVPETQHLFYGLFNIVSKCIYCKEKELADRLISILKKIKDSILNVAGIPIESKIFVLEYINRTSGMIYDISFILDDKKIMDRIFEFWEIFIFEVFQRYAFNFAYANFLNGIQELFLRRYNPPNSFIATKLVKTLLSIEKNFKTFPHIIYSDSYTVFSILTNIWANNVKAVLKLSKNYIAKANAEIKSNKYKYGRGILINKKNNLELPNLIDAMLSSGNLEYLPICFELIEMIMSFNSSDITNINYYENEGKNMGEKIPVFKDNLTAISGIIPLKKILNLFNGIYLCIYQSLHDFWILKINGNLKFEVIKINENYAEYCQIVEELEDYSFLIKNGLEKSNYMDAPNVNYISKLDKLCSKISERLLIESKVLDKLQIDDYIFLSVSGEHLFNIIFDALYADKKQRIYQKYRLVNIFAISHLEKLLLKTSNKRASILRYFPANMQMDFLNLIDNNDDLDNWKKQLNINIDTINPLENDNSIYSLINRIFSSVNPYEHKYSLIMAVHGERIKDRNFEVIMGSQEYRIKIDDFIEYLLNSSTLSFEDICLFNCFSDSIAYQGDLSFARALALTLNSKRIISSPYKQSPALRFLFKEYFNCILNSKEFYAIDAYRKGIKEYISKLDFLLLKHPNALPIFLTQRFIGNPGKLN